MSEEATKKDPFMAKASNKKSYGGIAMTFRSTVAAVRVLGLELARFGDEHDKAVLEEFAGRLSKVAPRVFEDNKELAESITAESQPASDLVNREIDEYSAGESIDFSDPSISMEVFSAIKSLLRRPPVQGALLRRGALITLVSFLETLISQLLHIFYSLYPEALPPETRSLTLADLRALGSIEQAEGFLVAKEIDSLLRESLATQLEYFEKRLHVDLTPLSSMKDELIEIFQRRNLIVHNEGIVNRYYLETVSSNLVEKFKATEGETLGVSSDYLESAIDIVHAVGIMLSQQCWRKWSNSELTDADAFLVNEFYDDLVEERFILIHRLAACVNYYQFTDDERRRIILINTAIAFKRLGNIEDMRRLLESIDWSSCALRFHVALAVLQDEEALTYELLPRAIAAGEISEKDLKQWPLFAELRDSSRFNDFVETAHFPRAD